MCSVALVSRVPGGEAVCIPHAQPQPQTLQSCHRVVRGLCKHGHKPVWNPQIVALSWNRWRTFSLDTSLLFFPSPGSGSGRGCLSIPPGLSVHSPCGAHLHCLTGHYLGSCECSFPETCKVLLCKAAWLPKHSCVSQACGRAC